VTAAPRVAHAHTQKRKAPQRKHRLLKGPPTSSSSVMDEEEFGGNRYGDYGGSGRRRSRRPPAKATGAVADDSGVSRSEDADYHGGGKDCPANHTDRGKGEITSVSGGSSVSSGGRQRSHSKRWLNMLTGEAPRNVYRVSDTLGEPPLPPRPSNAGKPWLTSARPWGTSAKLRSSKSMREDMVRPLSLSSKLRSSTNDEDKLGEGGVKLRGLTRHGTNIYQRRPPTDSPQSSTASTNAFRFWFREVFSLYTNRELL
jgi:hypothetical protein